MEMSYLVADDLLGMVGPMVVKLIVRIPHRPSRPKTISPKPLCADPGDRPLAAGMAEVVGGTLVSLPRSQTALG
jgi:hypothetical protein